MHLTYRNVNRAFFNLIQGIYSKTIPTVSEVSRNGAVLRVSEPVLITYEKPKERVLLNPFRRANPFFHLFESLWMLAGRNDVASIKKFISTIDQFSDDGETFNGAYGYRWRRAKLFGDTPPQDNGIDQLQILIKHLKDNPTSRRAVLQMWNVEDDLLKIDESKDVCCNTAVYFSIRQNTIASDGYAVKSTDALDITVTNRSNDLIWGTLGSDYVTFSILQEYVATQLGIQVGQYHQFANNLHVYTESNSGWLPDVWLQHKTDTYTDFSVSNMDQRVPLVTNPKAFDVEVAKFIDFPQAEFAEPFLETVAKPMIGAYLAHKEKDSRLRSELCHQIKNADWKLACQLWFKGLSK